MKLRETNREEFASHLTNDKADRFARTFVAKCDMMQAWDKCMGAWYEGRLAGAIVVTVSKKKPLTANLQLLHTFNEFRGKGIASRLCEYGLQYAFDNKAEYFRVSAELDAVAFYEKFGFKMVCRQKTAQLAMFRLTSPDIRENDLKIDEHIWKQMNRKGKGGCIDCFVEYKGVDFYSS
jgi:ribosomal protein S18 acetylase RimI-like enzyme